MRKIIFIIHFMTILLLPIGANSQEVNRSQHQLSKAELLQIFQENPQYIAEQYKDSILKGIIQIGMNPREAQLAGGACAYRVQADNSIWGSGINPLYIIDTQVSKPDQSKIWLTFKNKTQFGGSVETIFVVYIERGKVISITKSAN